MPSTKKKIIVFATSYAPFVGGAEIAIQEVSRRLCDTYDFFIITARQKPELSSEEVVREGTIIRVGWGSRFDKWLLPVFGIISVWRIGTRSGASKPWQRASRSNMLLWGIDISQGSLAACAVKIFFPHIPFLFTIQYGYGDARLEQGRGGAISFAFSRMLKVADMVTAISSYLSQTAKIHGFAGMEMIIPNGVDMSLFVLRNVEPVNVSIDRHKPVIITVSRLVYKNGIDTLIRAVAEVKKKYPSVACRVLGDGPDRESLEALAKELKLEDNVVFLGGIPYEKLPSYLSDVDVFARPSRSEGMGNSFVEALSVGVPAVGTAVGGIPDIIIDRETGMLCKEDDPRDLSDKILLLLEDRELADRVRIGGRRLVEEKFSWHMIASSYARIFETLLTSRVRILVATPLYPPEIGGPATYSKALVDGMREQGVCVRLARFSEVRRLPRIVRHAAYAGMIAWRSRYADMIYAQDPVSVGFPAAIGALITHKKFTVKIVGDYAWEQGVQRFGVTELLDDFLKKKYGWRVEFLRGMQRFTARRALSIVVPSRYLKTVVRQWGISEEKITVIENSFEISDRMPSHTQVRNMRGFQGFLIVSAGRLVAWKGFNTLINAVGDMINKGMPVSLVIIGSGPQEQELRALVHQHGWEAHIQFAGRVSHEKTLLFLASADAFVLNTGYEGFSHVVLEAMALGVMVVTTRVGGNPELVSDGKNGLLVGYNDSIELTRAIHRLMEMKLDDRIRFESSAREMARRFTGKRMLARTKEFFISL